MNYYSELSTKIFNKKTQIAIIGLGYVGLPLALQFSKNKFNVTGFDIDEIKINKLNKAKSYIKHISDKEIKNYKKRIFFTSDFKKISFCDVIILCLPTPVTKNFKPDLSFIKKTMLKIKKYLCKEQILILESST